MTSFVIHYHNPQNVSWFNGKHSGYGTLAEAAREASQNRQRLVVLIPGEQVLLTTAHIPGSRQQAVQAVPFVLEEHLADEPEDLHFSLGSKDNNDNWPIAIIAREYFNNILKELTETGLKPQAIITDILALPHHANEWTVWQDNNWLKIRTGDFSGYAVETENYPWLISKLLETSIAPEKITFIGKEPPVANIRAELNNLPVKFCPAPPLWQIDDNGRHTSAINLLQGEYQPNCQWQKIWQWRIPAVLIGVIIIIYGTMLFTKELNLRNVDKNLSANMVKIYRQTFPASRHIINPRIQMKQQLDKLTAARQNTFSTLLTAFYPALNSNQSPTVLELQFNDRQLEIHLSSKNINSMDAAMTRVSDNFSGKVQLHDVTSGKDGVQATMVLTK